MKYAFLGLAFFNVPAVAQEAPQPGFISQATSPQPPVAITPSPNPPPSVINAVPQSELEKYPYIIAVPAETPPPGVIIVPPTKSNDARPVYRPPSAPIPPSAHIVAPPQARRPAQSYISADDYPPVALRARQEGWVDVLLTIGPDGRVVGCNVFASSGSGSLDLAACNLLRRRARYTPARDSNGNAVVGTVREEVEWRLP